MAFNARPGVGNDSNWLRPQPSQVDPRRDPAHCNGPLRGHGKIWKDALFKHVLEPWWAPRCKLDPGLKATAFKSSTYWRETCFQLEPCFRACAPTPWKDLADDHAVKRTVKATMQTTKDIWVEPFKGVAQDVKVRRSAAG